MTGRKRDRKRKIDSLCKRKNLALELDLTWVGASKTQKKQGTCCLKSRCSESWDTTNGEAVKLLRVYLSCLDRSDELLFLQQRLRACPEKALLPAEEVQNSKIGYYVLEPSEHILNLLQRIAGGNGSAGVVSAVESGTRLPPPGEIGGPICQSYLVQHLAMRGRNYVRYQYSKYCRESRDGQSRTNFSQVERKVRQSKTVAAKTVSCIKWLNDQIKMHMCMPDSDETIIPYPSKIHTHAEYVLDCERVENCPWWEHTVSHFYSAVMNMEYKRVNEADRELDMGDIVNHNLVNDQVEVAAVDDAEPAEVAAMDGGVVESKKEASPDRYGNPLLGPKKDGYPELASVASLSHFRAQWKDDKTLYRRLKLRKWLPFAKCDTCVDLRKKIVSTRSDDLLTKLRQTLGDHLKFIRRERMAYAMKRQRAIHQPREFMSMIIDGADQSKFGHPHSAEKTHSSDSAWKLKMHLLGVLVHGIGSYAYTCPSHVAQGHNVTIQALWDTLVHIKKKQGWLPPVLYLQLDNTTKSCKGKWLCAFLALLLRHRAFKKILISFLPVGHTHEDIDQFFGCLSRHLRMYDAHSRKAFAKRVKNSFKFAGSVPVIRHWDSVGNISGWLAGKVLPMKNITAFHQFRLITSNTDGEVWLQGRRWPGAGADDHWGGCNGNDIRQEIFTDGYPDLLMDSQTGSIPSCARAENPPSEETIAKIRDGLDRLYKFLRVSQEDQDECDYVFKLYSTPASEEISFNWPEVQTAAHSFFLPEIPPAQTHT